MAATWFGWGVPLLQRHWSLRWGECSHCGVAGFCPSYETTKMVVALGIPLFPLGQLHIHEECVSCGEGERHGLDDWETEREEMLVPALSAFAANENDAAACSRALQRVVEFGELEEFQALSGRIEAKYSQSPEILHQLAWCHGHFAQFGEAQRLFRHVAQLDDRPERHQLWKAYEALPASSPPSAPSSFLQGLRVLIGPLILIVVATAYLSSSHKGRVESAYVVNGSATAYEVLVNGERLSVPPKSHRPLTLSRGLVKVSPPPGSADFAPFEFTIPEGQVDQPTTVVINPDRLALISWEERVYRDQEAEVLEENADISLLYATKPNYFFDGITDHFEDPPDTLEVRSHLEESYRVVLHHLKNEATDSLCARLLEQGESELANAYCRLHLQANPGEVDLLPYLVEVAPNEDSLTFLEARLEDRPVRVAWHLHYVGLALQLGRRTELETRYTAANQASPEDGDLLYLLSLTRKDHGRALADLERAASLGSVEALLPLARRHTAFGEFDQALGKIELALGAQPKNLDCLALHQELLLAIGKFPSLIDAFRERFEEDLLDQQAALTLAGLYEANGQGAHAQAVVDRYVQGVSLDGALVSEETAASRSYFAGVRAQWAGDANRFIRVGGRMDEGGALNVLILKGEYVEAAATVDRAATDPFLHFLLYGLTAKAKDLLALSEVQLSQALSLLEETHAECDVIKPWFRAGATPPKLADVLTLHLPNHERRVLLFALAQRHPEASGDYERLAKKLNYHRAFPYLALKKALE